MKYIDYQERAQQGTFNFPIAFYHQTPHSPRYDMQYHWHTQYEIIRIISGTFQLKTGKIDNALSGWRCYFYHQRNASWRHSA